MLEMKKIALALAAMAVFTGSALAADMAPRTYSKAPAPIAVAPSWTGFWVSGGFGYAISDNQNSVRGPVAPFPIFDFGHDNGGKGWLGKVGAGADYQFAGPFGSWVVGLFGDYSFSNISGNSSFNCPGGCLGPTGYIGSLNNDWSWAFGGRLGYVALPGLLTYVNGGYTQGHFKGINYFDASTLGATGLVQASHTRDGWFLGGGTEYSITQLPGLFWKTEYRVSEFGSKTYGQVCLVAGVCGAAGTLHSLESTRSYEQAVTTELVYRFNWGGPVVSRY
jgi:outer membrane immunogenic protein